MVTSPRPAPSPTSLAAVRVAGSRTVTASTSGTHGYLVRSGDSIWCGRKGRRSTVLLVGLDEVVQLGLDAEVDAHSASSMNSAIDAVNPCNALRPAIGPISPAAKKPASGMPPSSSSIVDAS